jgi:hypothetical protein
LIFLASANGTYSAHRKKQKYQQNKEENHKMENDKTLTTAAGKCPVTGRDHKHTASRGTSNRDCG